MLVQMALSRQFDLTFYLFIIKAVDSFVKHELTLSKVTYRPF